MPTICAFKCCTNRDGAKGTKLFEIPVVRTREGQAIMELTERRRRLWLKMINRKGLTEDNVKKHHKVCADHFVYGKPAYYTLNTHPDWVPSLKLGYTEYRPTPSKTEPFERLQKRNQRKKAIEAAESLIGLSTTPLNPSVVTSFESTTPYNCAVFGCTNRQDRYKDEGFANGCFYTFPRGDNAQNEPDLLLDMRRKLWEEALHRYDIESSTFRICSNHFVSGQPSALLDYKDPDWVPSRNLGNRSAFSDGRRRSKKKRPASRNLAKESDCEQQCVTLLHLLNSKWCQTEEIYTRDVKTQTHVTADVRSDSGEDLTQEMEAGLISTVEQAYPVEEDMSDTMPFEMTCECSSSVNDFSSMTNACVQTLLSRSGDVWPSEEDWLRTNLPGYSIQSDVAALVQYQHIKLQEDSSPCWQSTQSSNVSSGPEYAATKQINRPSELMSSYKAQICHNLQVQTLSTDPSPDSEIKSEIPLISQSQPSDYASNVDIFMTMLESSTLEEQLEEIERLSVYDFKIMMLSSSKIASLFMGHPTPESPLYYCEFCWKCFFTNDERLLHMKNHENQESLKCTFCKHVYNSSEKLVEHSKSYHFKTIYKRRILTCRICGDVAKSAHKFRRHAVTHTGERPFLCDRCGKSFVTLRNLNTHTLHHDEDIATHKPFLCQSCGKRFISKYKLQQHQETHLGVKPFACGICDHRFTAKSSLYTHMRLHTGEKPYACPYCDMRFSQPVSRRSHVLATHGNKLPYKCDLCFRDFPSIKALLKHEQELHSDNTVY